MRTSRLRHRAPAETRRQSDGPSALGEPTAIPTLADARDGLGESAQVGYLRFPDPSRRTAQPSQAPHPPEAPTASFSAGERRRFERDLHDGVQTELVALIVKLALAQQDPRTPPGLADDLAKLEAHAQAALNSVRNIARGIYPPLLNEFGVTKALRAQTAAAAIHVSIAGTASRSDEKAEEAVYFCCSEAIQNAAKHAGPTAKVKLSLQHQHGTLAVRLADDGQGFDPAQISDGTGLRNIRERIEALGGVVDVSSKPGRGTVLTLLLPWPVPAGGR